MDNYKDRKWLTEAFSLYGNKQQIGRICGVSGDTIEYWRKKFNIPKSNKGKQAARKHIINQKYFEIIDSEHKAYWLGFLMADGCVSKTSKNGPYNRFEINIKEEDIELLEQLNNDMNSTYEIKTFISKNKKRNFESSMCSLRINSKKMTDDLILHGIVPNKTGKEKLPSSVPEEYVKDFIRGFFDGDGSITSNGTFRICSSSKELLESFNVYFYNTLGIKLTIYDSNNYNIPFYTFDSNNKNNNLLILSHIYTNATVYLDRKYKRYMKLVSPLM